VVVSVVRFQKSSSGVPDHWDPAAMPTLKNARHERFAQLLASGKTATDAYELAGYKRDAGNSSHLAKSDKITSRVQEITTEMLERERATARAAAERCVITRQSLIAKAEAIYVQAKEAGQTAAAIAALKEIGVLSGIRIERRESGAPGEFEAIENMTAAELRAFLAAEVVEDEQHEGSVH
jgi:phage terminase small subunit